MNETIEYGKALDQYFFGTYGVHIHNTGFSEIDDLLSITGLSGTINTTQTVEGNFW